MAGGVRCLSLHAGYRCHHSGACCTANWPIPIEVDRLAGVRATMAIGRLRTVDGGDAFVAGETLADGSTLIATRAHACVFFDERGDRMCRIHETLGHAALPLACRQFPRVSVSDPRGTSVTLSHYCPTARAMLDRYSTIAIVSDAAFPDTGEYIGLDATSGLPPLLRPDVLMDWESWWEWERLAVERIAGARAPIDAVMATLADAVEHVRAWAPGDGALIVRVRQAFSESAPAKGRPSRRAHDLAADVLRAVPEDIRPDDLTPCARPSEGAMRGFVAAHAFANWTGHLGRGLRTWLRSLEASVALIDAGCDIRQADLLLRHLADPYALATTWSQTETDGETDGVRS